MRWNLDPVLLAILAVSAAGYWYLCGHRSRPVEVGLAMTGYGLLALIFLSPLCALTSALFSARVAHHLVMIGFAVPLLVLGMRTARPLMPVGGAALLHAVVLWFWHAPHPYMAALGSDLLFWAMQVSLLATAWLFWQGVFTREATPVTILMALLGTIVQMGLLGALITFAPEPLYPPHLLTTAPWGLTALEDQQLAGLIMWIPSVLPYLLAGLVIVGRFLGAAAPGGSVRP